MSELNISGKSAMLADLIVANNHRQHIGRIMDRARSMLKHTEWIEDALCDCQRGNYADAYETWKTHFDELERFFGLFVDVAHQLGRPRIIVEKVDRIRTTVASFLHELERADPPLKAEEGFAIKAIVASNQGD